jgi:hydrogenase maturation protein HypF
LTTRVKIVICGAVQGVGFRPFVFRLAHELGLRGYVLNAVSGLVIEAEGEKNALDCLLLRLSDEKPAIAVITSLEPSFLDPIGYGDFTIRESFTDGEKTTLILPDTAVCNDCLQEMLDPNDRRYLYPFINCTNCGPRFSIIEALPYDRPNTSMKEFAMCDDCRREYHDPGDRRFHAQPIACPICGPSLALWDEHGRQMAALNEALLIAVDKIKQGSIVALKGIGGFQLIVDAGNEEAVKRLRQKKHREEKPFALMFPDLQTVQDFCQVSELEKRLLKSPESPIVLLKRKHEQSPSWVAPAVAPGNPYLGVMLPYSPLHHLLLRELRTPIVATSANLAEEPILTDEREALQKLAGIADFYLVHNRRIVRHVDDSIVRIFHGREMVMRRARGYAPLPIQAESQSSEKMIAVGGHLKNTVAVRVSENIFISQHIGDLSTLEAECAFEGVIDDFQTLYDVSSAGAVCDLHPDYFSTKFARDHFRRVVPVQHHAAHVAACIAENQLTGPVLGVGWDGVGLGDDGHLWGGEFFIFDEDDVRHVAQFDYFPLPGGETAIKEPRRSALGLLYSLFDEAIFKMDLKFIATFSALELSMVRQMLVKKINAPLTSSVGRLFDAIAALLDINQKMSYEGQAAMMLEWRVQEGVSEFYPFELTQQDILKINCGEMIREILMDLKKEEDAGVISAKFHNTLAEIIAAVAERFGIDKIAISGGVFQNVYLLEQAVSRLQRRGFKPYWHQRIPTNDGGISVGQIILAEKIAALQSAKEAAPCV